MVCDLATEVMAQFENASKGLYMSKLKVAAITLCLIGALPMAASAQSKHGPSQGDREFSLAGTGSSDKSFDGGSVGVTGDLGWYFRDNMVAGIRQSANYAKVEGGGVKNDYWNGSTRGYLNYNLMFDRAAPFIGASLGGVYGDGIEETGFAGLETGLKYYVRPKTFILARVEYQFFFDSGSDVDNAFKDDGAFAYTLGLGYHF